MPLGCADVQESLGRHHSIPGRAAGVNTALGLGLALALTLALGLAWGHTVRLSRGQKERWSEIW